MAMGKRLRDRQPMMWVPTTTLPTSASHPFYARLNQLLRDRGFDDLRRRPGVRASFYAAAMGRPGLAPGIYFRGSFAGRVFRRAGLGSAPSPGAQADSLTLRDFLGLTFPDAPPDHSGPFSGARRLIDLETHRDLFTWVLARLGEAGLIKGQTIAHRCDHPRSQRGVAAHRAPRHRRELSGLPHDAGARVRRRDTPRAPTWHDLIGSGRRRARTRTGPRRRIPTRGSPR